MFSVYPFYFLKGRGTERKLYGLDYLWSCLSQFCSINLNTFFYVFIFTLTCFNLFYNYFCFTKLMLFLLSQLGSAYRQQRCGFWDDCCKDYLEKDNESKTLWKRQTVFCSLIMRRYPCENIVAVGDISGLGGRGRMREMMLGGQRWWNGGIL